MIHEYKGFTPESFICPNWFKFLHGTALEQVGRDGFGKVMEGVVFSIYEISSLINAMGIETNLVKASGGGTRSELWRQMQADIFNCSTDFLFPEAVLTSLNSYVGTNSAPELRHRHRPCYKATT